MRTEVKDVYRRELEQALGVGALGELRQRAWAEFERRGFPTVREEAWRFTNVAPIARAEFESSEGLLSPSPEMVARHRFEGYACAVFVNGRFEAALSDLEGLPSGVTVGSLAAALGDESVAADVGRHARSDRNAFAALNTALWRDGAFLDVGRSVVVERPIQLLFLSGSGEAGRRPVAFPRLLLRFGEQCQARVLESWVSEDPGCYFNCPVSEILVGPAAVVDHYRVQRESTEAFHVSTQQARLDRASRFSSLSLSIGGGLVRNDVNGVLLGEGAEGILNGLYLVRGRQHVDHHMRVDHVAPHCHSHELFKGILEDRARAVFDGLIHVHPGAQKTDAVQTNRNLLLSEAAIVNTNPQLEIYADDVKCTHGSTVGQLDEEAVYYLRSRGIGLAAAKSLLTYAFASEVVGGIALPEVRRELEEVLFERLPRGEVVREAV